MKRLQLTTIQINNFMGCREAKIDFTNDTVISGANGSGKSTIYEAFLWLITGKNSKNQSDFEIKNTKDNSLNRQDHSVTAIFKVDSQTITLNKTYKEIWTKKRGSEEAEYTGNQTEYLYNNVPVKMSEFKDKISLLIPEHIFKLITNVKWFNEMDWKERRKILSEISGSVSDQDIANSQTKFIELLNRLTTENKTIDELKREIAASKKKIKDDLIAIPIRISEASQSKIESIDYSELELQIQSIASDKQTLIAEKENRAASNKKALDEILLKQNQKNELERTLTTLQNENKNKQQGNSVKLKSDISILNSKIESIKREISSLNTEIAKGQKVNQELTEKNNLIRSQWQELNSQPMPEYDESKCNCPTCKQRLPEDQIEKFIETYKANYVADKKEKLNILNQKGISNKKIIEENDADIILYQEKISILDAELIKDQNQLTDLNLELAGESNKTYEPSQQEIDLAKQIQVFVIPESPKIDNEEINLKIQELDNKVSELNRVLGTKNINSNIDERIKTLEKDEKSFAQSLSDLEKQEHIIFEFEKTKIEYVENKVNQMFQYTTFKMFEQQINGALEPCCIAMYDGVPYNSVNTAGKINMGLDIINVLSNYYKYQAPVFIDNRESVGILIKTDLQIINMEHVKNQPFTVTNN